jgi:transposase
VEHIGIDVHKNQSQVCILTAEAELIEKRIRTDRNRFAAVLGSRPPRCLEAHGHEVIVADPNYAPMYAHRTRRVKTDRRDARALAEACRVKAYRRAHRAADDRRHVRGRLAVREALVQTRTKYISLVRALLRREGLRVRPGGSSSFVERVNDLQIPGPLQREIAPILRLMSPLNRQIEAGSVYPQTMHGAWRGTDHGGELRGHDRQTRAIQRSAPGRSLPRPGTPRAELGREAAKGTNHQGW